MVLLLFIYLFIYNNLIPLMPLNELIIDYFLNVILKNLICSLITFFIKCEPLFKPESNKINVSLILCGI